MIIEQFRRAYNTTQQAASATERMRAWTKDTHAGEVDVPAEQHQVREHHQYRRSPSRIFKHHLFRPVGSLFSLHTYPRILSFWVTVYPWDVLRVEAGVIVPANPELLRLIPVRLPGFLELHAGIYGRRSSFFDKGARSFSLSLLFERYWRNYLSWYLQGSWVPKRGTVDADEYLERPTKEAPRCTALARRSSSPLVSSPWQPRSGLRVRSRSTASWPVRARRSHTSVESRSCAAQQIFSETGLSSNVGWTG